MTHTFYLKNKHADKSLIYFSCYFKEEGKKFVYSTGEKIAPDHWSFDENRPKLKGSKKDSNAITIKNQLGRYSDAFEEKLYQCKSTREIITSKTLKEHFNETFKKAPTKKDLFFMAYEEFMVEKRMLKQWKSATEKRYKNVRNILKGFMAVRGYNITFSTINKRFYAEFTDYCYSDLNHASNTFSRNVGYLVTFMHWAVKSRYTYNQAFLDFERPKIVETKQEVLTLEQVEEIFQFNCKTKKLEHAKDLFVFQCLTGLRYSELRLVNKRVVKGRQLEIKEDKNTDKPERKIPLSPICLYILKKYDYKLPVISNQKQNEYIKDFLEEAEYNHEVEYSRVKNTEKETKVDFFHNRISTHTARRTFATIMRNKGVPDKTIMEMTGHKDYKTFNIYHKVDDKARAAAIEKVFGSMELPKLRKA
ncbi:tyrosine-type recombinase/integrase [Robertkochia flava]|uniref:tyrosine-type recombinase/integrase n=1 Tax=Robertkochia flava TaxID=3447986 RepID=UPI001CCAB3D4|nr:tyrosine-type recombinase/integrase [Robertkochia marina]